MICLDSIFIFEKEAYVASIAQLIVRWLLVGPIK